MSAPLEITVLYGVDIVHQTFQAVATIVKNKGWYTLLVLAESIGIIACIIQYIKTQDLKSIGLWMMSFVIITSMLITPTRSIVVTDLATPSITKKVDNVPVGLVAPFYLITSIGNGTARMYDTFFAQPDEFQYTKTGLLFGQKLLQDSYSLGIKSPEFNMNFGDYTNNCIVPDMQLNGKYSVAQLFNSDKTYETIFSNPSPVRGIYYKLATGGDAIYLSCRDASKRLAPLLEKEANNPSSPTLLNLSKKYSVGANGQINNVILPSRINNVYHGLIGASQSTVEILKQNLTANALRNSMGQYPASRDASADLIGIASQQSLMKMKLAQLSSYEVAGEMLPALHTAFLTLMIGIFPIMVLALFIRELTWSVVKNYLNVLGSLMLWPILFAIFNHIINTIASYSLAGQSFTISNMDVALKNASSMAGIASWLMLSIPFISFRLFTGLGQQIASAGSYLGNALMSATSADASSVASGNYNFGNMSMQNVNGFKTDLNQSFRSGMSSVQTPTGGMVSTTESGQHIYEANMSKLPMNIDTSSMLDSSFSKALGAQQRETQNYQEGYRSSVSDTFNTATALSNNFAKSADMESGLTQEQRDSIEQIRRQSSEASNSMSSSDYTNSDYRTVTQSSDSFGVGAGVSGNIGAGTGNVPVKANVGAEATASYRHQWFDANEDSASFGNRTSDDKRVSESFADSKSAQVVKNMSDNDIERIRDSETRSLMYDLRSSLNKTSENYAGFNESQSKEKTISQQANLTESNRLSASESLGHEYAQFVTNKMGVESATRILTDAGTPEMRDQREQLKEEFTNMMANNIRNGHFNNESNVVDTYNGMNVSKGNGQFNLENFKNNNQNLANYANKGGIIQNITTYDLNGGKNNQSLLDGVNYNISVEGKASKEEQNVINNRVEHSNDLSDVKQKINNNQIEISEQKGFNKNKYDEQS